MLVLAQRVVWPVLVLAQRVVWPVLVLAQRALPTGRAWSTPKSSTICVGCVTAERSSVVNSNCIVKPNYARKT